MKKYYIVEAICIQCGKCKNVCEPKCIDIMQKKIDKSKCTGCGLCKNECPCAGIKMEE